MRSKDCTRHPAFKQQNFTLSPFCMPITTQNKPPSTALRDTTPRTFSVTPALTLCTKNHCPTSSYRQNQPRTLPATCATDLLPLTTTRCSSPPRHEPNTRTSALPPPCGLSSLFSENIRPFLRKSPPSEGASLRKSSLPGDIILKKYPSLSAIPTHLTATIGDIPRKDRRDSSPCPPEFIHHHAQKAAQTRFARFLFLLILWLDNRNCFHS